jgi:hypothetical protein
MAVPTKPFAIDTLASRIKAIVKQNPVGSRAPASKTAPVAPAETSMPWKGVL